MFLSEYNSFSRFFKHSLGTFLSLLLLAACSPEDDALPGGDGDNTAPAALRIEVSASDFTSAATRSNAGSNNSIDGNNAATRATDNGAVTTFESGDRIGIIVLDGSGNVLSDNIPYKYNGNAWNFDNANGEGKTALYYDNKATAYVAYFPYSPEADGITGADIPAALKAQFPPRYDQRTKEAYRASDLLVWSNGTGSVPLRKLEIKFTHAYSSLSLSPSVTCKIDGAETSYIPSSVDDVSFTIGTEPLLPYRADDGSYRIIVSPQTTDARWFCTYNAKTYNGTVSVNTLVEEHRYTLAPSLNLGDYSLDKAKMGDFYCKSSNGSTGYLIPREIAELSDAQRNACLGIVMKVGKDTSGEWKDTGSYKQKDGTTDMSTIHGYVLALKDGNDRGDDGIAKPCAWGPYGTLIGTDQSQYTLFCGYKNTQMIKEYAANTGKTLQNDFPAAYHASEGYEQSYPSPTNSSGWFLPSAGQCWYWCQNRDLLKVSMDKVGGNEWQNLYWSSSEYYGNTAYSAWYLTFYYSDVYNDAKHYARYVRACLAF